MFAFAAALVAGCGTRASVPAPRLIESPVFGRLLVEVPERVGPQTPIVLVLGAERAEVAAGAVVVPLETTGWQRRVEAEDRRCWYPAGELVAVAAAVSAELGLPPRPPALVGRGWGARVAVAALLQAPEGSFAGVAANAFCPELPVARALCGGEGWTPGPPPRVALPMPSTPPAQLALSEPCAALSGWTGKVAPDLRAAAAAVVPVAAP